MKASHLALAVAAGLGLAYLALRGTALGAGGATGLGAAPPGSFDPSSASNMPDFEYVTEGVVDGTGEADWMYAGFPPTSEDSGKAIRASGYYAQMWRPASRISLQTITQGDLERAALFLGDAWRKGAGAGCGKQSYDVGWNGINERLEATASGLDIGAQIGVGLASAFGFGAAAQASDSAFGFGRGASESREGKVDLNNIATPTGSVGLSSAIAFDAQIRPLPSGDVIAERVVKLNGATRLGVLANLFYGNYLKYEEGWADLPDISRHFNYDAAGNKYIKLGFAYPWFSSEMGCGLTLRERVYVRARMYRVIDLIQAVLYPSEPATADAGGFAEGEDGWLNPVNTTAQVTHRYVSARFGALSGTLFPPLEGDRIAGGAVVSSGYKGPYTPNAQPPASSYIAPTPAEPSASAYVPPPLAQPSEPTSSPVTPYGTTPIPPPPPAVPLSTVATPITFNRFRYVGG